MTTDDIIAIITGISGLVMGVLGWIVTRQNASTQRMKDKSAIKRDEFDTLRQTITEMAEDNKRIREDNTRMAEDNRRIREDNDKLHARIEELEDCVDEGEVKTRMLTAQIEEWKSRYDVLNQDWMTKYAKLQAEFDQFKQRPGA